MTKKLLFTPGPITTSATVKSAMLRDAARATATSCRLCAKFVSDCWRWAGRPPGQLEYECVLMQGSGTFAIESVISSAISREGKLVVLVNGAYGRRIAKMARVHAIETETLERPKIVRSPPEAVTKRLAASRGVTHAAVVHCETTTGMVNPIEDIGAVAKRAGAVYIVDAIAASARSPWILPRPTSIS